MTFSFFKRPKKEAPIDRVNRGLRTGRLRGVAFRGGNGKALHRGTRDGKESIATIGVAFDPLHAVLRFHRQRLHRNLSGLPSGIKKPRSPVPTGVCCSPEGTVLAPSAIRKTSVHRVLDEDGEEVVVTGLHEGAHSTHARGCCQQQIRKFNTPTAGATAASSLCR